MSGQSSGPLPDIPTRWTTVYGEAGGTGPSCNAAQGSWEYDGESARVLLGATAEEINQKDCEVLPWMSAVQGAGLYLSTPRESSKGSDRGPNTLPSDWSGLCRTFEVPEETKNRGKGLHPTVCLQPYRCRAVCVNLETTDFIRSLMCFIAPRGRPRRIYSDNAKTFVMDRASDEGREDFWVPHPAGD